MNTETSKKQKITPYLWFDHQAEQAANYYIEAFSQACGGGESRIASIFRYGKAIAEAAGTQEGAVLTVDFQVEGLRFVALNGGPNFHFTPAISFTVHCSTEQEIDLLWLRLSAGGQELMPLGEYPFSRKFGWTNDRFGLSWQLTLSPGPQKIVPSLLFVGDRHGKAEEAIRFYISLFEDSSVGHLQRYEPDGEELAGTLMHGSFTLDGLPFTAMDSALDHAFTFTEAISLQVSCTNQQEVDRLWAQLTAGGEEQPCGWLKDRFGVSWQIVPEELMAMLDDPDPQRAERAARAMLQMTRIDIAGMRAAVERSR